MTLHRRPTTALPNRRRTIAAAVLPLVLVAVSSGCSDSGTGSSSGRDSSAERSTTTAPTTTAPAPAYVSENHADPSHWVCRPDRDDICSGNLDTTVIAPDGTLTVEPFVPAKDPAIDCFYVYPTISRDPGTISDWNASDQEEGYAALNQVARLRSTCRVFAPVYRQRTLASLINRINGTGTATDAQTIPYADVLDAWRTYLADDNDGRGVVLVGHSQGSGTLSQLIAEEIDPDPAQRELLVAAYLAGTGIAEDDDGSPADFPHLEFCTDDRQVGCIISWASFRSTAPPPETSYFGAPRSGDATAACNNPAQLDGGSAETHNVFATNRRATILASGAEDRVDAPGWTESANAISTPFVSLPGLLSAKCATKGRFNYLEITVHADPADPRADDIGGDLTPEWGLHLVDLNVVMGDVESLVATQATAWAERR